MDLRHMRFVVALAQEKHFERAARTCHVSQPALSAAIRQLEVELGVLIVERGNRFLGFTREGELVLEHARRMLAERDALLDGLAAAKGTVTGHLAIGIVPTAMPLAGDLLAPFARAHPGVTLGLLSRASTEIEKGLEDFTLHGGFTYLDNEPLKHVRTVELYRERYGLLVPAASGLGESGEVTWAEAAGLPLCLLTPDMQNRRIIDAVFRTVRTAPRIVVETNSLDAVAGCVRRGEWASVVPLGLTAGAKLPDDLRLLRLVEPDASHALGLVVADRSPLSPLVDVLWRSLQDAPREASEPAESGTADRGA